MFGCRSMLPCIFSLPEKIEALSLSLFLSRRRRPPSVLVFSLFMFMARYLFMASCQKGQKIYQTFCPPPQTLFRHSKTLTDTILWLSHPPQTLLEQTLLKFPPSQTLLEQTFLRFLTLVSPIGTQLADSLARFQSRFQKHCNHLH